MQVSDVMTRRVISVAPNDSINSAIELMLKHRISGLPVIDDKSKLVSIVTEGDFLRRPEIDTERRRPGWREALLGPSEAARSYVHSHGVKVKDVMTQNPVSVGEDIPLDRVVQLMESRNVKRLPVMRGGRVIGIISRANLMHALVSIHRAADRAAKDDAKIRGRILDEIAKQSWGAGVVVDVVVRNGVADLWGTIYESEQARALGALVESTPGITRVRDYLTCMDEPVSAN
jgi:CBS domain-containing protein